MSLILCSNLVLGAIKRPLSPVKPKFKNNSAQLELPKNTNNSTVQKPISAGFDDFIRGGKVHAYQRSYYFTRPIKIHPPPNKTAVSFGGALSLLSGGFLKLFHAGVVAYTAQPFGLKNSNPMKVDQSLPGYRLTMLGQSYLQFDHEKLSAQGGNILVDTPWISPSDNRMIPSTYSAVYSTYKLSDELSLIGTRIFRFKSHTKSNFTRNTLYNPNEVGGTPIPKLAGVYSQGAFALAISKQHLKSTATLWYYQFYDYAKLLYGQVETTIPISQPDTHWVIKAQALTESATGRNFIQQATKKGVGSTALGGLIGLEFAQIGFFVSGNLIPLNTKNFFGGDIISPYTTGYATDPLFTTSMIAGLVEKGAGHAVKFSLRAHAVNERLLIMASYARYHTLPVFPNSEETDVDVSYWFQDDHQGLLIRNRFGIEVGKIPTGQFIYNRVMLSYVFL